MTQHIVCLTFDFDAQSGFISRGLTTPTPISRGEFGVVASKRILDFLRRMQIPSTWFVPGFTIESYPEACERIVADGHEIGHHSWAHIVPASQTREKKVLILIGHRNPSGDSPDKGRWAIAHRPGI